MKSVYSAPNISLVSVIRNILEGEGIRCSIRNQYLSAGMGELPPIECWPQLCVLEEDYPAALRLVQDALAVKELSGWKCATCGEEHEGQFTACWKCGAERP